jgi:hypothetical protein
MRAPHRRASAENLGRSPFPLARSASPPPSVGRWGATANYYTLAQPACCWTIFRPALARS